jgi:adhesin/invasin
MSKIKVFERIPFMKAQYTKITIQVILVCLFAFLISGCGESGSPGGGTGPGETASIALATGSDSLPADGFSSTSVTASLTDSVGQSVNQNTELTFHTNLGHFRNGKQVYSVETPDDSGTFVVQLTAGTTAGTAEIICTSNSITQKIEVELMKSLPPVTIDVNIAPSTVNPNGTSSVKAIVKNVNDEPAADETIIFSVQSSDSGGEFQTLTATTNVNGEAEVNYVAGSAAGEDLLKATAETNGVSGSATLVVDPDATVVDNITVVAGADSIIADGITEVAIRATVTDIDGNPASGKMVKFQTTAGLLTTTSRTTDMNGIAEVSLRSSTTTGTATVRADADGFFSEVDVAFVSGAAQSILVYASPETVNPGDSFQISAAPLDSNNNRLSNERLTFTVREVGKSKILDTAEQVTDEQGVVRIDLSAAYGTNALEITVETSNGTSNSVIVEVDEEATVVGSISLSAGTSGMVANGNTSTKIRATVLDKNGAPAPGIEVDFDTTLGSLTPTTAATGSDGIAEVSLKTGITIGTATVTGNASGFTDTVDVDFTAGAPANISIDLLPDSVPPEGSATIVATVTDSLGNPLSGEPLNFKVSRNNSQGASISPTTSTTNANGEATAVYTAGVEEATDFIMVVAASRQSIFKTAEIEVDADIEIGAITLTATEESIPADGSSSTGIQATVTDSAGNPVPRGTRVSFSTSLGRFSGGSSQISRETADASGTIVVTLIAGTEAGTANVTATSGGASQSIQVAFEGSGLTVGQIDVRVVDTTLDADGNSQTSVIATVKTADNQAVPDATVTFSTTAGTITTPHTTDENGQATATLTSDRFVGPVTVTAESQGISDTATLSFVGITLEVEARPTSLNFNGSGTASDPSTITATLKDAAGVPIAGETITFTADADNDGTPEGFFTDALEHPFTDVSDANGQVEVDLYPDQAGTITVSVDGGGLTSTVEVNYSLFQFTLSVDEPTIFLSETATITATLTQGGTGQDGETVDFSTSLGNLSPQQDTTGAGPNPQGQAITTLTPGTQTGTATIDASVEVGGETLTASTSVVIVAESAVKIILVADPSIITVDTGTSTIRAFAYDTNDQPVGGQSLYFRINDGPGGSGLSLSDSVVTTDSNGQAEVILSAGSVPSSAVGDVEVEANTLSDFTGDRGLAFLTIAGPVANISVSINLEQVEASEATEGHLDAGVSAIATDVNGNPVADGTNIFFGVRSIGFDEDRDYDERIDCWLDEDANNNGTLDPGEDIDGDGQLDGKFTGDYCFGTSCGPDSNQDGTLDPGFCFNSIYADLADALSNFGVEWFSDDVNLDGSMYEIGGDMAGTEDANGNGILDPGEDKNGNGVLDPPQGVTVSSPRQTTAGIATTVVSYPMSYANNVKVRITAESGGVSNFYDSILLCTETMVDQGTCGLGY